MRSSIDSHLQEFLLHLPTLDVSLDFPEFAKAADCERLFMASYQQSNMRQVYRTYINEDGIPVQRMELRPESEYRDNENGSTQVHHNKTQDLVVYQGEADLANGVEPDHLDDDYIVPRMGHRTDGRGQDAGTVLRSREAHAQELRGRVSSDSKAPSGQQSRPRMQFDDARGFSEIDDQIFYPSDGKNLPRSPAQHDKRAHKRQRGQQQYIKHRDSPVQAPADAAYAPEGAPHQTFVPDWHASKGQFYPSAALETHSAARSNPRRGALRNSHLRPESPAFSALPPPRPAVQPSQHTNSLLQLLTQGPRTEQERSDAKIAAQLNRINKIAQRDAAASNNDLQPYPTTFQTPNYPSEFAFGSNTLRTPNPHFENHAYQGATTGSVNPYQSSQIPRQEGPNSFGSTGSQGSGVVFGQSEGLPTTPFTFNGTTHYGYQQ